MLIVGAGGFAKEILEIFYQRGETDNLVFYDDVNILESNLLYSRFPILTNEEQAKEYFNRFGNEFTLGIGNPLSRVKLRTKFEALGGTLTSSVSPVAKIGTFGVEIGKGCNVLSNATFSNSTKIGEGCIVYYNSVITHDCIIGDYVEISPSVNILGNCRIGDFTQIGSNATILPRRIIGANVIIGAGSVITKNIPDNSVVVGVPGRIIK